MNPLFDTTLKGTLGELIAQTFLLANGVQAAAPVKDSGNDLIAIRGHALKAVQVKTSAAGTILKPKSGVLYHILAVVHLPFENKKPRLNLAKVFLFPIEDVPSITGKVSKYPYSLISEALVLKLWTQPEPERNWGSS